MATNKYFNLYNRKSEQNLLEDLIIESIKIHGVDTYYLPRHLQKQDLIYGEDVVSKFDDYFEIELYIENVDGFEGQGDLFRKFGLEVQDQATLIISRSRFEKEVGKQIDPPRPREGDLILFPENDALMEIKFVSNETMAFYQLGEFYVYKVNVAQFVYSHEDLKTGIPEIDETQENYTYQFPVTLGAGSGAYLEKETVYQGVDLPNASAKAIVVSYIDGVLTVRDVSGAIANGQPLIGSTSGASYLVGVADRIDIKNDGSASNKPIEDHANTVVDFSEKDPFSEENY